MHAKTSVASPQSHVDLARVVQFHSTFLLVLHKETLTNTELIPCTLQENFIFFTWIYKFGVI